MSDTKKTGPIYGVELIDSLPIPGSEWTQAMPSRCDLEGVDGDLEGQRVVAGYEVLLSHWRRLQAIIDQYPKTFDGVPIAPGMEIWAWLTMDTGGIELHPVKVLHVGYDDSRKPYALVRQNGSFRRYVDMNFCGSTREAALAAKETE